MASPSKKLQKFGTQAQKSPVIFVFRNGDKHHKGEKITLKAGKTLEQFLQDLNQKVGVVTGSVRQVFTADGKLIKKLEDIEDGAKYVCAGAEKFDSENAPLALKEAPAPPQISVTSSEEEAPKLVPKKVATPKKIEKFGTQTEKSKVIYVFRNGDKNHEGEKMTVHSTKYKTFEQLREAMTREVKNTTGPVLKVVTPEGKQIKDIAELENEGRYICCGAEALSKDKTLGAAEETPKEEKPAPVTPKKKEVTVAAYKSGVIEKFGTQSEKAKVIYVFKNGDKNHQGIKLTVHPTKFKTFDQLKLAMSNSVQLPTGPVRQVFTPEGKLVKGLEEFVDEAKYVCAGAEKFNKELLPTAIFEAPKEEVSKEEAAPPEPFPEKKTIVNAYKNGVEKFGTQSEKARVITVFRNGDKNHAGQQLTIHATKFKTFDQLKEGMTRQVGGPTGPVLKVYTPEGKLIKALEEFEDGGKYICAGAEKFNKDAIPSAFFDQPKEEKEGSPPSTPKKVVPAVKTALLEKFGTQTEKAKNILVFRNGDKNHEGEKMAVHIKKYKNLDQLKEAMSKQVGVHTGPVRQIFTPEGKIIKSLDEFEDEGRYICAGAEKFNKQLTPPGTKVKPSKPASNHNVVSPKEEIPKEAPIVEDPSHMASTASNENQTALTPQCESPQQESTQELQTEENPTPINNAEEQPMQAIPSQVSTNEDETY